MIYLNRRVRITHYAHDGGHTYQMDYLFLRLKVWRLEVYCWSNVFEFPCTGKPLDEGTILHKFAQIKRQYYERRNQLRRDFLRRKAQTKPTTHGIHERKG